MSAQAPMPIDPDLFEAYLDGRLSGAEASAVEEAIARDPELAAEVELQRRITASLRGRYVPPAIKAPAPASIPFRGGISPLRRWISYAAAAVIVLGMGYWGWNRLAPTGTGPEGLYRRLARDNYRPDWVCRDDKEFQEVVHYRLGDSFLVHAADGVALIGWKYVKEPLSPQALALMGTVDGEHSVVLVDRKIHDEPLAAKPRSGLNVFRREIGMLVLYEITPLKEPRLLDLTYQPPKEAPSPEPPAEEPPTDAPR